jgi:hypothetical protein
LPPSASCASCRWSERWRASTSVANGGGALIGARLRADPLGLHRHEADGGPVECPEQIRAKADRSNSPILRRPAPPTPAGCMHVPPRRRLAPLPPR